MSADEVLKHIAILDLYKKKSDLQHQVLIELAERQRAGTEAYNTGCSVHELATIFHLKKGK